MKIEVSTPSFTALAHEIEGDIAKAATGAMRQTAPVTTAELREQTIDAGLGGRIANAWRNKVYPDGATSVDPAGLVYATPSRTGPGAAGIFEAFVLGATIKPVNGAKYLAIPTKNVPRATGGRGSNRRMTPDQVEAAFDQDLWFKRWSGGELLAFINAVASRSGKGWRRGTRGRLASGRNLKPVLMFTFVPAVRMPKLLDLDEPAERWAAGFEDAFTRNLGSTP